MALRWIAKWSSFGKYFGRDKKDGILTGICLTKKTVAFASDKTAILDFWFAHYNCTKSAPMMPMLPMNWLKTNARYKIPCHVYFM